MSSNAMNAFNEKDFSVYVRSLQMSCLRSGGSIMFGMDPITCHLRDDFVAERIASLSHAEREAWELDAAAFGAQQIKEDPSLVKSALSALLRHKIFYFDQRVKYDFSQIKDDYEFLERECAHWIQSEANIFNICLASLKHNDMLSMKDVSINGNMAGREMFERIKAMIQHVLNHML